MREHPSGSFKNLIGVGLLLTPIILLCVHFIDLPVASFVKNRLYSNAGWSRMTSDLPDLLFVVVLVSMLVSLLVYQVRSRRGIFDRSTAFAKLVLWIAPSSYLVKTLLKMVFGRVNTRCWLQEPELYGFHFFQMREGCEGFPSGHTLVIVTLLAALWRFYPGTRPLCLAAATLLGIALVATNYHFVSDVLAGAYFGVLLEAVAFRLLIREPLQPPAGRC